MKRRVDDVGASDEGHSRAARLQIEVERFEETAKKLEQEAGTDPDVRKFLDQWAVFKKDWTGFKERLSSTFSIVFDNEIRAKELYFNTILTRYEMLPTRMGLKRQAEQIQTLNAVKDGKLPLSAADDIRAQVVKMKAAGKVGPTPDLPQTDAEKIAQPPPEPKECGTGPLDRLLCGTKSVITATELVGGAVIVLGLVALVAAAGRRGR